MCSTRTSERLQLSKLVHETKGELAKIQEVFMDGSDAGAGSIPR